MFFGKKRIKKKVTTALLKVENDTLRQVLKEIGCIEHKEIPKDGTTARVNYEMTVTLIRERVKVALSIVDGVAEKRRYDIEV